jgi:hypothetical protein
MATDVRQQFDTVLAAHEYAPIVFMGQTAPVSKVGYTFVVPHIRGGLFKNISLLCYKKCFVRIGVDVQLSASWG